MAGKPIRLGKAAGELNVSISTLVDFLQTKGIKVDSNPNQKLEEDHYEVLRQQFAADHDLKEQSKMSTVSREKRETVSIRDKVEDVPKKEEVEDEDTEDINVEDIKRQIFEPEVEKAPQESRRKLTGSWA